MSRCGKREHRLPGMVRQPGKRCATRGCTNLALWGETKPTVCEVHRGNNDKNHVHLACAKCGLPDLLSPDTSLCGDCNPTTIQRATLAKQRAVKATLDLGPHKDYAGYDKQVEGGSCGRERPDFWWDCGTHIVVLEVDENQHAGRAEACECARMVNLSQAFGLPTHFIRYNPDEYKAHGGRRKTKGESTTRRHALLAKHLDEVRAPRTSEEGPYCSMTRLYYDDWKPSRAGEVIEILGKDG